MSQSRAAGREPSTDQVLESVADETRRDALAVLLEQSAAVSVGRLATAVAAIRTGTPFADVARAERKPIAVALVHVHLPKLSAAGMVSWEPGEDVELIVDRHDDDGRLRELLSETVGTEGVADGVATATDDSAIAARGRPVREAED